MSSNSDSPLHNSANSTPSLSASNSTPSKSRSTLRLGSQQPTRSFTASMQDAQARNKDPESWSDDDSADEFSHSGWGRYDSYDNDNYERTQKRRQAAVILDNPELLLMHSQARFDSIAGTRLFFTKIMCGYETPNKNPSAANDAASDTANDQENSETCRSSEG